jgi:protein-L-isoaspartate O-methyltransferase
MHAIASTSEYVAANADAAFERERLRLLGQLMNPMTTGRLHRLGVARGWRCLEVGAGDGSVAGWLARRVGPTGRVVATDIKLLLQATGALSEVDGEALRRACDDPSVAFGRLAMVGAWGRRAADAS